MKKEWLLVILALLLGVVIARFALCPTCPTCPTCPPPCPEPPTPGPVIDISSGPADGGGYAITLRRDGNVLSRNPGDADYRAPSYFFYKVPQPRLINSSTQQMWFVTRFQASVNGGSFKYVKSGGTVKWTCTDASGQHDLSDGLQGWETIPNCLLLKSGSSIAVTATEGGASYSGDWGHLETELP